MKQMDKKDLSKKAKIWFEKAKEWLKRTKEALKKLELKKKYELFKEKLPEDKKARTIILADIVLVVLLIFTLLLVGCKNLLTGGKKQKEETAISEEMEKTTKRKNKTVSFTISAVGDCTFGTDENFAYEGSMPAKYDEVGDFNYFFENVKSVFEEDDLTIVNFEGTLTDSTIREDKQFAFKADKSYAEILTDGFVEAANLANNHSKDYGEQSYNDTMDALDEAGITNFGYDRVAIKKVKGIKVGLVGTYVLADGLGVKDSMEKNIQDLKDEGAQVIIASFHWGEEKAEYPNDVQVELAHAAIDAGADLVLGHHPHVLQGIEQYKGKNIVYSLGNFCFGGNMYPSDMDTMIFQQTFTLKGGKLQEDNVTNIIPCSISSVEDYNNYQPTPAAGEKETEILNKITQRSQGLSNENTEESDSENDNSDSDESYDDSEDDNSGSDEYDDSDE
ncbi:MAG: CapA family protein [Blautia stercoris]|jgi:poly-gamma-glutamate capsule biosynthesis protein CapA/YwtB (metallophosphatase superfamily)